MYKKRIVVFLVLSLFVFTAVLSGSCDKATSDPRLVESLATLPVPEEDFLGDIQNTEITFIYTPNPSIDLRFNIDVFSPYPSKYPNMETVPYSTQNYLQLDREEQERLLDRIRAHVEELKKMK
jgi:hypothetical protein